MPNWISLTAEAQLDTIKQQSFVKPQVIYKHSTRCSLSSVALRRLNNADVKPDADYYFLDLIRYRSLSDTIAHDFRVHHESPQLLLIKNGECVYEESHLGIDMPELAEQVDQRN